jgi:hypothetical protein
MAQETEDQVVTQPKEEKKPEWTPPSKEEWERSQRDLEEARTSERFWAQRAKGHQSEPQATEEPVDTDGLVPEVTGDDDVDRAIFEDPAKWTEALTQGPKAVKAYVRSLGLVSAQEAAEIAVKAARQVVGNTVQGMQADARLTGEFSELQDPKSELFKTTQPIFQELVAMNGGKQTTALLFAAAKAAKAQLDAAKPKPKPREEEDPYDRYEDDRRARADAQGAGRGRPAAIEDDDADLIGPEARELIRQMNAAGGQQITEKEFMESQKRLGTRRARR